MSRSLQLLPVLTILLLSLLPGSDSEGSDQPISWDPNSGSLGDVPAAYSDTESELYPDQNPTAVEDRPLAAKPPEPPTPPAREVPRQTQPATPTADRTKPRRGRRQIVTVWPKLGKKPRPVTEELVDKIGPLWIPEWEPPARIYKKREKSALTKEVDELFKSKRRE